MPTERQQIEAAINGLESQRKLLGDEFVDAAVATLRAKLENLSSQGSAGPSGQSLKQVTILFLDVVGSTALSERLDPEDIDAVMNGALARFGAVVEAHQGRVLRLMGDGMLAVFGASGVREDDAERAVHAGLALLGAGKLHAADMAEQFGLRGFDVRVGVHTGIVLIRDGSDANDNATGMALNIAARMEQTAPPGCLRISHDTYRHVCGVFDVEQPPPIQIKGVKEPVVTYLVHRAKPRAFRIATRGIEGVETRMIGRDAEFAQLQRALESLDRADAGLTAITVIAEAGVGKSRLLYEFQSWIDARAEAACVFLGRAYPSTQSQPYGLLRDFLAGRLEVADGDSMEVAKEKFEAGVAPLFEADDGADLAQAHAHLLGHLVGLDFAASRHVRGIKDDFRQIRNRGFHAAAQVFRRIAARDGAPIVLLLEDLHWADDGSLDFLNYVTEVGGEVPMLVLCLTRPELFERRPDWGRAGTHQRINLSALDNASSRRLAGELLQKLAVVPPLLRDLILQRANGNPFCMEELIKMLIDQGAIEMQGDQWIARADKLVVTSVPQTLMGVLQARLDSLSPGQRLALQQASVIGYVFWDLALAAIDAAAPDVLPSVTRRELVTGHNTASLGGAREYAFAHKFLHDVTYGTVLKRMRREYHAKAAQWLADITGERAGDFLGAIAEHYERAGDGAQACVFFVRAAEHAGARYLHDVALSHVARAMELLDGDAGPGGNESLELRWRLLLVREYALNLQGMRSEQRAALDALEQAADALGNDRLRALAAKRRSNLGMRTADFRTQEAAARRAMALAERAGDVESRLEAQRLLADALTSLGDATAGEALAREGLAEARARGLRRTEGVFLNVLSMLANLRDDQVAGLEFDQLDLPIWRELEDMHGEAVALGNVGADWLWFGEHERASQHLESALKLSRAVGARMLECSPLGNLSQLYLREGDAARALAHAREALDIGVSIQAPDVEAQAIYRIGDAELALGNHGAAAEAYEQAESIARAVDPGTAYEAMAGRARVALARNDVAGATAIVEELLALAARSGGFEGVVDAKLVYFVCHLVLARAGDPRAPALLARAHDALQIRADTIGDAALRHSFLTNVPHHREIVKAWAARNDTDQVIQ